MFRMLLGVGLAATMATAFAGAVSAAEFGPAGAHKEFQEAFNARDWEKVRILLADEVVFQRASSTDVFAGPDAVIGNLQGTIADQWNVKFAKLEPAAHLVGKDGRVVERGDFAVTAGAASDACYAGSYMMTWAPKGDGWALQILNWQDVETDMSNC
jgi:hypothetical protein